MVFFFGESFSLSPPGSWLPCPVWTATACDWAAPPETTQPVMVLYYGAYWALQT